MHQHISDRKLKKYFGEKKLAGTVHYLKKFNRLIRYITIDNGGEATLFLIHGAPASFMMYADFFADERINQMFKIIAIDRPGFGRSGYGNPEPSIIKQADVIKAVIEDAEPIQRPLILYGTSYGASIACRYAMNSPNMADGLVLVGPSLAPGEEKYFWITGPVEHSFLRKIIPPHFRSANTEKYNHRKELEKLLPYWNKINIPVLYLQGGNDKTVYPGNAGFAKERLTNVPWLEINFIPGEKHVLERRQKSLIIEKVLQFYNRITNWTSRITNWTSAAPFVHKFW